MTRIGPLAIAIAILTGCANAGTRPDNDAALSDILAHRSGDEVVIEGAVTRVFRPSRGESGEHERFIVRIGSGAAEQDVLIADNITVGVPAPVRPGDDVVVKGVLEVDPSGPVIHWTHHDPRFRHPGGFVMLNGKVYD